MISLKIPEINGKIIDLFYFYSHPLSNSSDFIDCHIFG